MGITMGEMRVLVGIALFAGLLSADGLVEVFNRAVAALAAGDYAAAESGFREVLRSAPDNSGAMLNLGVTYSRMEKFDYAIRMYRAVLQANPTEKSALANLAVAYVKQRSFTDAFPVLQKLTQVSPESAVLHDPEVLYQFASGYLRQNRSEESRQQVEKLLARSVRAAVLCKLDFDAGRYDEAASECRQAGAHRDLGKVLVSQHSPEAVAELKAAIRQDPKDAEAEYYLGVALMQDARTIDAVPHLERAMALDNAFWGTYFYVGRARLELGQNAEGAPQLRRASELNPRAAVVFYELGRALMAVGQSVEAKQAMERVRELRAQELDADAQALRKR
jgi:tetratricopeptide (TPR) repeat protein